MIFVKVERSKVRTLQARILEKARIYMALGVFYLGCYWLTLQARISEKAQIYMALAVPLGVKKYSVSSLSVTLYFSDRSYRSSFSCALFNGNDPRLVGKTEKPLRRNVEALRDYEKLVVRNKASSDLNTTDAVALDDYSLYL